MLRTTVLVVFGAVATWLWTAVFANVYYWAYMLSIAPAAPTRLWHNTMMAGISGIIGIGAGCVVTLARRREPTLGWLAFAVGAVASLVIAAFASANGVKTVVAHARNYGTYGYFLGSLLGTALMYWALCKASNPSLERP